VAAMGIPHTTEPYLHLRQVVQLPATKSAPPRARARPRRAGT